MIFNAEKIKKELECDSLVLSSNIYYFYIRKLSSLAATTISLLNSAKEEQWKAHIEKKLNRMV